MYSLPAARSVDWSLSGYPSGIPTVTTIACNVRNFGAKGDGTSDDTDAFESAINLTNTWDATTPKVCYIPSGTYKITRRLYPKSGMVFRGDGSNTTTLKFYLGSAYSMHCFEIMGSVGSYQAIVSGATKGSNAIVVTDATNFAAGDVLDLRQSNNNDWWTTDVRDYQKVGDAGTVGAYAGSSSQGDWAVNCRGEMAIVQGKVGNTITLDHALFTTLDATKSPSVAEVTAKKNIGFEYLKVERGDAPSDEPASWGCHFFTQYANKVWHLFV
jgi:polygalacturonase